MVPGIRRRRSWAGCPVIFEFVSELTTGSRPVIFDRLSEIDDVALEIQFVLLEP